MSNALFDPIDGLVAKRFTDPSDRAAFRKCEEYGQLHALVEQKMQQTGVAAGAEPTKSGKFVVRLPRTMHSCFEREAIAEGNEFEPACPGKTRRKVQHTFIGGHGIR